ncbi:MAG: metallophosphoesterase family protein [Fimbriiglobus sp.]
MRSRTLAIGDIHGATTNLVALLEAVKPRPDDWFIFLGDYVDRGPDSKGTLNTLIAFGEQHHCVFLRGNHELMMMRARKDLDERRSWFNVGGRQCLASYGPSPGVPGKFEDIPRAHWEFLTTKLVDWLETDTHIFAHAGVDPELEMKNQNEVSIFWDFLTGPIHHKSGKTVIVGHTSQKTGQILNYGSTICIDTHAYAGKYLTCLEVLSGHYWQADVMGRVHEDDL